MEAFQRRANQNGGTRAAPTPGYEASLTYVERRLQKAGYDTERHAFDFATYVQNGPATLQREGGTPYVEGTDEAANDYYRTVLYGRPSRGCRPRTGWKRAPRQPTRR